MKRSPLRVTHWIPFVLTTVVLPAAVGRGGGLPLPPRIVGASGGRAVAEQVKELGLPDRERVVVEQVLAGNVPEFWRHFVRVRLAKTMGEHQRVVDLEVAPDYVSVGSDADFVQFPLSPTSAQRIADALDCALPTPRMVDAIYAAAAVKLAPEPMPPGPLMTTVAVFVQHADVVRSQREPRLVTAPLGALIAGHKKDVVITARLEGREGKVAIYGWHRTNGAPIQPLFTGHAATWVDYSHGVRLVRRDLLLDGKPARLESVLADPELCVLLSDEASPAVSRYEPARTIPQDLPSPSAADGRATTNAFSERLITLAFEPAVRVMLVEPQQMDERLPVRLVLYALPNGNTIEQTMGKQTKAGDDWHFDIQHIAAQARWLRETDRGVNWVLAYLECAGKAWPAWRRKHDSEDKLIPRMVDALTARYAAAFLRLVLSGHSGGGSFTFGYLNGVNRVPDSVERIAFLDSNYAYDESKEHAQKLADWLKASRQHHLSVLAYHDSVALLDGKTFVTANGGTWGRSHAMQRDLAVRFAFETQHGQGFERYRALEGRVLFLLKENPERAILHTRQVEWNGFIHAMLSGTDREEKGYRYFGQRVYERFIAVE